MQPLYFRDSVGCVQNFCPLWYHCNQKSYNSIIDRLIHDHFYRCSRLLGTTHPTDARNFKHTTMIEHPFNKSDSFCYLGVTICAGGGKEVSIITPNIRIALVNFRKAFVPISKQEFVPVFGYCVRSAILQVSECWLFQKSDKWQDQKGINRTLHWVCRSNLETLFRGFLLQIIIEPGNVIRCRCLQWFGNAQCNIDHFYEWAKTKGQTIFKRCGPGLAG